MVGVSITDDAGTPADTTDDWTLTKTSGYVSGDTDNDGALDLTEVWVFTRTGVALQGQYANIAVVSAQAADNANQPITALGATKVAGRAGVVGAVGVAAGAPRSAYSANSSSPLAWCWCSSSSGNWDMSRS